MEKIQDYAFIGDCHSGALFASLLDQTSREWSIAPISPYQTTRLYLEKTNILQTTFSCATGQIIITTGLHDLLIEEVK